jgi:hypothetical protein
MSKTATVAVIDLNIDLNNFRTVSQTNEVDAIRAMIAISPDMFWGLTESLVEDGYLPTENIIVLKDMSGNLIVKEGNRRVGALKLLLGLVDASAVDVTPHFEEMRAGLSNEWIAENSTVPCNVYDLSDAALVDRIVTRTHGKNAKAGRDDWESVARARHNRSVGAREPGLDLLEKYLQEGTNLTKDQRDRWAGKYKLTVLDEAIKRVANRCDYVSSAVLAADYPKGKHRKALEDIMFAIGSLVLDFPTIRDDKYDFALRYGIPAAASASPQLQPTTSPASPANPPSSNPVLGSGNVKPITMTPPTGGHSVVGTSAGAPSASVTKPIDKTVAVPMDDERSMRRKLKALKIHGPNRDKIQSLKIELGKLKLKDHPMAICFLLRSVFELSAKAYCEDHKADGLASYNQAKSRDKVLVTLLGELVSHMTQSGVDKEMDRKLSGAMAELGKQDGLLSTMAMNQLVHNLNYVILPSEIPLIFGRIFPLLEQLNK